jgi:hypothetical protein
MATCEGRAHLGAAPRSLLLFRGVVALRQRHGLGVRALLFYSPKMKGAYSKTEFFRLIYLEGESTHGRF